MKNATASAREAMGMLVEEPPSLSRNARDFLRRHPREARLAVAVALETAAAQGVAGDRKADADVPESLKPFIVSGGGGEEILGVSEAAARLEVSRTTVYEWAERRTLLAWRTTRRGLRIPAAQILGPGRVVPDLADVVDAIGDVELAWSFLTREWPFAEAMARPLDLLAAGRTGEVLDAAPGFGAAFT